MTTYLTVKEAAERIRRSPRFVLDELRRKNLRGSRYGGAWSIAEDDLETYLAAKANVSKVRRAS